jgi:hypothetical protein
MGLLDQIHELQRQQRSAAVRPDHMLSKVDLILQGRLECSGDPLSEVELQELREVLQDRMYTPKIISLILKSRGYEISENSIKRYRSSSDLQG